MNIEWIMLSLAVCVGIVGMIGEKRRSKVCIAMVSIAMPILILAALWCEVSLADLSTYFCIISFGVMLGLPERGAK